MAREAEALAAAVMALVVFVLLLVNEHSPDSAPGAEFPVPCLFAYALGYGTALAKRSGWR